MKIFFLFLTSISVFSFQAAFGYGNAGHQAVGDIAEVYLKGTRAENEVHALLLPSEDLARAATWADRAKLPDKYLSDEMKAFVASNPNHQSYHYCDIPFQETAYRVGLIGARPDDIVQTLRACIEVLKSSEAAPANPLKLTKRVALLLITHYMGDLHQPLHVGCSYVDEQNQFVNPETGAKGQPDAGANNFRLTTRSSLHGYWDTQTVKLARDHAGAEDFKTFIIAHTPMQPEWNATGPIVSWPEQWATDSLHEAKHCFEGITLGNRFVVPKDDKHDEHFEWAITLQPNYDEKARDLVEIELAKAGYRLAALLKAIWPETKNPPSELQSNGRLSQ